MDLLSPLPSRRCEKHGQTDPRVLILLGVCSAAGTANPTVEAFTSTRCSQSHTHIWLASAQDSPFFFPLYCCRICPHALCHGFLGCCSKLVTLGDQQVGKCSTPAFPMGPACHGGRESTPALAGWSPAGFDQQAAPGTQTGWAILPFSTWRENGETSRCSWGSPSAGHSSGANSIPRECSRPCSSDSDPSSVNIFWPGHWEAALCHQPPLGTASAAKGGLAAALPRAGLSTTTPRLLPSFHFPGCDP